MAKFFFFALMVFAAVIWPAQNTWAQTTEFTYQGSLKDAGNPASGNYDFEFALFDSLSGGSQVGATIPKNMVGVANGVFTVKLDFGSAFPGTARYLEIRVKPAGAGAFTPLVPRQLVNSSPYSVTAADATSPNIARLTVPNTAMTGTGMPVVNSGFITSATVTNGGAGYTAPPTVTVNDATGSGAVLTANISGGSVTSLTVQNPGSGYSAGATLSLSSPPSNANQTFVTPNFFTGVNTMNNVNNTFAGSFTGNGSGLTNVNAAQLGGLPPSRFVQSDVSGNVGIGASPGSGSKLTIGGQIEMTAGALKFPDATTQATAGLASVTTSAPLTGDGTAVSPLGITSPLSVKDVNNPTFQPFRYSSSVNGPAVTVPAGKRLVIETAICQTSAPGNNNFSSLQIVGGAFSFSMSPTSLIFDGATTFAAHNHHSVRFYFLAGEQVSVFCHNSASFRSIGLSGYYVNFP